MPNLVPFEEIEAIILLSVCQFILKNELAKNSMLMVLSNILRNYAIFKGKNIDDSFRSTSGLSYQTNVMLNYISAKDKNIHVPRIFLRAMDQYKDNFSDYEIKLWEGLIMSANVNKQAFLRFLTEHRSQSASDIFWSLEKAEEYLNSQGILNGSMYDSLSLNRIDSFESIISKDRNFVKKYKGMIRFLKMGFSVMKEYIAAEVVTENKPNVTNSASKSNSSNTLKTKIRTDGATVETKTETIESQHINASSVPISFSYYNRNVEGIESWVDLYVKFMKIFWLERGRQLSVYIGKSFVNDLTIDLGNINIAKRMKKPKKIADGVFIETALTYRDILNRIKSVLDKTFIPAKRFSITYKQPVPIKIDDRPSLPTVSVSINSTEKMQPMQTISSKVASNSTAKKDGIAQGMVDIFHDVANRIVEKPDEAPKTSQNTVASEEGVQEYKIDFYRGQDLSYTKPVHCYCEDIRISTAKNWTEVYTALFSALWRKHSSTLAAYIGKNLVGGNRIDLGVRGMVNGMVAPKTITDDHNGDKVYIETNLSAKDIVGRIKRILEICHIPFESVEIEYTKRDDVKPRMVSEHEKPVERITTSTPNNSYIEWLVKTCKLAEVTARHYYSSIRRAEEIAKEQKLASQRLLAAGNYEEAQATYRELLSNQKFISMNATAHNGFTASINKYLQYLLSGGAKSLSSMSKPVKPRYDKELTKKCLAVLSESFVNGIKKDAGIAKRKFRNAYAEKYGMDLSEDIDLDDLFQECALEYDGKFYAISSALIDFICEQLKDYSTENDMLFFYDTFYDKYISEFSGYGVTTSEMLKAVLEKEFTNYYYKSNCFATRRGLTLEQTVKSAYGEDICLSIDELQDRLPFIGVGQILPVLSRSNSGFARVADSTYAMESRVHIAQTDVKKSKQIITDDIYKWGYSFVKSIIVEDSEALNPEIPEQALQIILFNRYLSSYVSRNRDLISPFGESDSILSVLKDYCNKHTRITLEEVEEYEKEFTGENTARRSLRVVTDTMIRVSEDTFVNQIVFDIAAVDKAIEPFFRDRKIISLKNVSSFSVFPDVEGVAWNSYLLASYLRRYSERWGFIGEEHKKKSVGAIFDKSLTFDSYDDAIAQAVAESGIDLTQEEVCDFLLLNEYRLRKADFKDIISKAYQIRMREE